MKQTRLKNSVIRSLKPGDPIPPGQPRRYANSEGYVRLRWKVAPRTYVETYEHRVVDGYVTTAEQVHHKNHVRDDNRPENLKELSTAEHAAEHFADNRARGREMLRLYRQGLTQGELSRMFGVDSGAISRMLRSLGADKRQSRRYNLVEVDAARVAELYASGRSLQSLGREFRIDAKRVADLVRSTGTPIRRPGRPKTHDRMDENRARLIVRARSGGMCEVCGAAHATEFQHRKARVHGGPWDAANGLDVCGRGNYAGCHGRIHQNPTEAYEHGWSVRSGRDFRTYPVYHALHGWVELDSAGGYRPTTERPQAA